MMKVVAEPEVAPVEPRAVLSPAEPAPLALVAPAVSRPRFADYLELTKPRIAVMALFTVAAGYLLGAGGRADMLVMLHTLIGAGLVAAGGSALNQWLERGIDSRMNRTARRPLPAGRVSPAEALTYGVVLGVLGLSYLALTVPFPALVASAVTMVAYVAVYTPLKTVTVWNTLVGAVPGALPPMIGWCAARGWDAPAGGLALFLVLFLWQIPHFLAIAWMYRDDYARGGLRMLPIVDPSGRLTAAVMVAVCVMLFPAGLVPLALGMSGWLSAIGAVVFGVLFLRPAMRFAADRTDHNARRVLRASLLYLPGVLGLILIDGLMRMPPLTASP